MKLYASYQVQWWQTVLRFEIRFFAKRQTAIGQPRKRHEKRYGKKW